MIKSLLFGLLGFEGDLISKQQTDSQTYLSLTLKTQESLNRAENSAVEELLQLGVQYKSLLSFSNKIRTVNAIGTGKRSKYLTTFGCTLNSVVLEPYAKVYFLI